MLKLNVFNTSFGVALKSILNTTTYPLSIIANKISAFFQKALMSGVVKLYFDKPDQFKIKINKYNEDQKKRILKIVFDKIKQRENVGYKDLSDFKKCITSLFPQLNKYFSNAFFSDEGIRLIVSQYEKKHKIPENVTYSRGYVR